MDQAEIPIPPLAEKHRVVAAVNELMSLCGRLEAALPVVDITRRRLLDALLVEVRMPLSTQKTST